METDYIPHSLIISISPGVEGKSIWINTTEGTYYTNHSIDTTANGIIGEFILDNDVKYQA